MCKTIMVSKSDIEWWECDTGDELSEALDMPLASIPRSPWYADAPGGECCLCWVNVAMLADSLSDRYTMDQSHLDPMHYTFTRKQDATTDGK